MEYSWDDENGGQVSYDSEDPTQPEDFTYDDGTPGVWKLFIAIGDNYFPIDSDRNLFWAYQDDIIKVLDEHKA